MRYSILAAVCVGLFLPPGASAQVKVLFIGNSFTYGLGDASGKAQAVGGVPGIFDRLAQAGGHLDHTTVMRADPGVDFQFHDGNPTTLNAINSQPWTHVVLQNYSIEPTHYVDGSHSIADHMNYGSSLYRRIMTNNPTTQVLLYETWSRAAANTACITGSSGPQSFATTAQMQQELRTNYANLASVLTASQPTNPPVIVAPVGDAWQNAGGLRPSSDPQFVTLFESDNYHGNDNGYYLAAAVFYSQIYGTSPHGLSSNSWVTSLNLNLTVSPTLLEDVAWTTVHGPGQSPPALLRVLPPSINNGQLVLMWTGKGQIEWASTFPGPWTPIVGATNSPCSVSATGPRGYYRLVPFSP